MIKLSEIIILNVPKREEEGKYLKKLVEVSTRKYGIPVTISMDRGLGLWDNFSQALTKKVGEGTHRLIMHDDISFERNIFEKVLHILQYAPEDSPISLYNPTNNDYVEAYKEHRHVIATKTNFWLQCCIYPNNFAADFVKTSNSMTDDQSRFDDSRLKAYLQYKGLYLYAICPGLVQHFGAYRSTFNNQGAVGGIQRYSTTVDSQFDVNSVNWEEEFKHPFLAKSTKDWVKEIVNKEFLDEYKKQ